MRNMFRLQIMLLLLVIFHEGTLVLANGPIVNTTCGMVEGVRANGTDTGRNFTVFRGIPYAEPPVGQLRFAKPVPKKPWKGVRNASVFGSPCFTQEIVWNMDEDCLFLNVFVPVDLVAERGLLPVMIWIHGGSFRNGRSDSTDGTNIVTREGVVLVTLNYRLGPLGFLFTGDDAAPGNYGLWDQKLAIHWVKDNIENFGGNPQLITIFGVSAGGFSVMYQAITPLNDRSLFQRVISQSGGIPYDITLRGDGCRLIALAIGEAVGCEGSQSPRAFVECLRSASAAEINKAQNLVPVWPCIDGDFIPHDAENLLASSQLGQYDLLIGVNSGDGSYFVLDPNGISANIIRAQITSFSAFCRCENPEELTNAILFYYTICELDDPKANQKALVKLGGDLIFFAPTVNSLHSHYQAARSSNYNTNTYFYYFQVNPQTSSEFVDGAPHASEKRYVFGTDMFQPGLTEADRNLSAQMMAYWTNFAKIGDPNADDLPFWPGWTSDTEDYIILDSTISYGQRLARDRMAFWREYLRGLYDVSDPNTCPLDVPVRGVVSHQTSHIDIEIRSSEDNRLFGKVTGRVNKANSAMGNMDVAEFLGIPYAQPPLAAFRFKPSREISFLPQGINFISKPPACPQPLGGDQWMTNLGANDTSEDCLTLNIYAPLAFVSDTTMPVAVYIHHGYGLYGTASVYDATTLASKSKSVVVVINYRLGVLGFLSTGDEAAPGNAGLHDIITALKWVSKYIGSFSGDPSRVTVLGYGTGASLTHILTVSESSRDLFQRAVLMSGSAFSPMVTNFPANPADQATALAKRLDCPIDSSDAMITCLQEKPVTDLIKNTPGESPPFTMAFPPVVDGNILVKSPLELLKIGQTNSVDLIIGMTQNDVDDKVADLLKDDMERCPSKSEVQNWIENAVRKLYRNQPDLVALAVVSEYMAGIEHGQSSCPNRERLRKFFGDILAAIPTIQAARHHFLAHNTAYLYSFDQDTRYHYGTLPSWAGTCFGDDLQYLFGFPYWPDAPFPLKEVPAYRPTDRKAALEWMTLLSNFINHGSPGQSPSGVNWLTYSALSGTHISIDWCPSIKNQSSVDHTYQFWTETVPAIDEVTTPQQEPFIDGGLGLHLTPNEANTVIKALFGTCISLGVVFLVLVAAGFVVMCTKSKRKKPCESYPGSGDGIDNPSRIEIKPF